MKQAIKHIMFFCGIGALLCACSAEDMNSGSAEVVNGVTEAAVKEICTQSDVPIMMVGASSDDVISSKASIGSDDDGNFTTTDGIGAFMLATGYAPENTTNKPEIHWAKGSTHVSHDDFIDNWYSKVWKNGYDVWSVYYDINNQRAEATASSDGVTTLQWTDNRQRCFPMGSYHTYSFYAYAPYKANTYISYVDGHVAVRIPIDGTQDVLWGKARGANFANDCVTEKLSDSRIIELNKLAYSANFFREKETQDASGNPLPIKVRFDHKFVKVKFKITPGAVGGSYEDACNTTVDEIAIVNAPSYVKMCIADNDSAKDGTFDDLSDTNGTYYARVSDSEKISSITPQMKDETTPDTITVGDQGIMMPLPSNSVPDYKLRVRVSYVKNNQKHSAALIYPMAVNIPSAWKAGEERNITLTIYHPEDIPSLQAASLTQWVVQSDDVVFE